MKRLLLLSLLVAQACAIGEVLNKAIVVAPPRAACNRFPPNCVATTGFSKIDAAHVPPNYQCPCPTLNVQDDSGQILGPLGVPVATNDDANFFVDEVLANGFNNPIGVSFSDSTPQMYVGERGGRIWHVDLATGEKKIFIDLESEVGFSGDRGLMDVITHPNYINVKQMLVMFTGDDRADGLEPDAESSQNQKIIRLQENNGVADPNFRLTIIGNQAYNGVPICFNTHALGAMSFGQDGSLLVTTGEGAHWNFDMGDWGQDALGRVDPTYGNRSESLDPECRQKFGAAEDIGAWRAQVLTSLDGKMLRITPNAGEGICPGSITGGGYETQNPFCDGTLGISIRSKIWARGLRNPFRMTMRPFNPTRDRNPGVFYFGDVGQGGYEEVNAVVSGGMNFGWPCWEGPMPCPIYRDSNYNDNANYNYTRGCGGSATVIAPCGPIETIARDDNGTRLTCPHMYFNYTTTLPFMFWTRFRAADNAGYFTEVGYTGQKFYGATTAGLAFYQGTKYPEKYWGQLFALDFTEKWIKVLYHDGSDSYIKTEDFADLIYSEPKTGAKVTLQSGPDGNICYVTMNGGEVRCFRYVSVNIAPTPVPSAVDNSASGANSVIRFRADGTWDRERDEMIFLWNFGDGQTSSKANPVHTFVTPGIYNVSLTCTDKYGNSATVYYPVYTNNKRPTVKITSPVPNLPGNVYQFTLGENVRFDCNVTDDGPVNLLTYFWDYQLVHNSHYHPNVRTATTKAFNDGNLPDEGTTERNNLRMVVTVTDPQGLSASDEIFVSRPDWLASFGNRAPTADFIYKSVSPPRVGQPIQFDARATIDLDGDFLTYRWSWGDGGVGDGSVATHTYDSFSASGYLVVLNVTDNWGYSSSKSMSVPVYQQQSLEPVCNKPAGLTFNSFVATLYSIEPGIQIQYELVAGNGVGIDVTPCSPVYTSPLNIPFFPNQNVTLLVRAFSTDPTVAPSSVGRYTYVMQEPPCDKMGYGTAGDASAPGSLFCINTETVPTAPTNISIPPKTPRFDPPLTENPPLVPTQIIAWWARRLNGVYDTSRGSLDNTSNVNLYVDQGTAVGAILKVRISYDFTGDGSWDRNETFENIGPNDVAGDFEVFNFPVPRTRFPNPQSITGTGYLPLVNGTVLVQFWEAISENINNNNTDPILVKAGDGVLNDKGVFQLSFATIPYKNVYIFQTRANNATLPSQPSGTTGCGASVITVVTPTTEQPTTGVPVSLSQSNGGSGQTGQQTGQETSAQQSGPTSAQQSGPTSAQQSGPTSNQPTSQSPVETTENSSSNALFVGIASLVVLVVSAL